MKMTMGGRVLVQFFWSMPLCVGLMFNTAEAQQYSFQYLNSDDQFAINNDGDRLYCLFMTTKSPVATEFRKVFLSEDLRPIDSLEYKIEGAATLITSGGNDKYTYHVFETKANKVTSFEFLITDKNGAVQTTFRKTSVDFIKYFNKEVKIKNISLSFLSDPEIDEILIEVFVPETSLPVRISALSIADGSVRWISNTPPLRFIQTTESLVVGLSQDANNTNAPYIIHFIDRQTGKQLKSAIFNTGNKIRDIVVVATDGRKLLIAGDEFQGRNMKNSHFFMTMYDLQGSQIFDRVDTTDRMGKYRRHLMGSIFDGEGNLMLIGEGYKLDATKLIAGTAANVAIGVLLGGPAIISNHQVENKVEFISSAILSADDGEVKSYYTFPVGPWNDFASFQTDGEHVLIGVSNKFLLYNVSEPNVPPSKFATLKFRERLLLTSIGPVISYKDSKRKRVVLELLHPE